VDFLSLETLKASMIVFIKIVVELTATAGFEGLRAVL